MTTFLNSCKFFIMTNSQKDVKNEQQSNRSTSHFEKERGASLPLNIAIAKFLNNENVYREMGKLNRENAKVFDVNVINQKMLNIYF